MKQSNFPCFDWWNNENSVALTLCHQVTVNKYGGANIDDTKNRKGIIYLVRLQNLKKKNNISYITPLPPFPTIRTQKFEYQGVRNRSFLGNVTYGLNEWSKIQEPFDTQKY